MATSLTTFDRATTPAQVTATHRTRQGQLNRVLSAELDQLWPLLVSGPKDDTFPVWSARATLLLRQYAQAAAAIGNAAYTAYRGLAVPNAGRFTPPVGALPEIEQIQRSLGWATRNVDVDADPTVLESAKTQAAATAQRHVTNTGRSAVVDAVEADERAVAWARRTDGDPCAFCALMASRGAVYKTRNTAGRDSNLGLGRQRHKFVGEGLFKFHDLCACVAVPVFAGEDFELEPHIQAADELYQQVSGPYYGRAKLDAFRRAYEGNRPA